MTETESIGCNGHSNFCGFEFQKNQKINRHLHEQNSTKEDRSLEYQSLNQKLDKKGILPHYKG